jgi:hypothetical protein
MDRLPLPARQPKLPKGGRTLRLSDAAQDRALFVRQEKRGSSFELGPEGLRNRDRAKVRLDAIGLGNPDQGAARESLVPHPIRGNRRIRLGGLKSFQLIDESECRQVKVVERTLVLRRMEVGHAPRVKALIEIVTETGKPGRWNEKEQEANDDFLQNVPPFGASGSISQPSSGRQAYSS